jgi:hypothetical protein
MNKFFVCECGMCGDQKYKTTLPTAFIHCDRAGCGAPRDVVPMRAFAFISRHSPTPGQVALAEEQGITLEPIGDMDAFSVTPEKVAAHGAFEGVVVVHPAAALRLAETFKVGVFENANRAPEGERPQFEAAALRVYDMR